MSTLKSLFEGTGIAISEEEEATNKAVKASRYPVIKIKMTASGMGAIWIGDFQLPYTTKVSFSAGVNDTTRVHIDMLAMGGVEVEAEAGAVDFDMTVFDKHNPVVFKESVR